MALNRRDFAVLALGAAMGLCGGDTAATAAPHGFRIRAIAVNTTALREQSGHPTAGWVQQALPRHRAFAALMARGDRAGATLSVRIDSVSLGSIAAGRAATDIMKGSATLSAGTGASYHTSLRATSTYIPAAGDRPLSEQALQGRMTTLSHAFAGSLAGKWGA